MIFFLLEFDQTVSKRQLSIINFTHKKNNNYNDKAKYYIKIYLYTKTLLCVGITRRDSQALIEGTIRSIKKALDLETWTQ